jgi:hypothetical protein
MNTTFTRKSFLVQSSLTALAAVAGVGRLSGQPSSSLASPPAPADGALPDFPEHDPQHDRALVKRFVIAGHFNLPIVKEMLAAAPTLINGAWDWGNGDFETALGGASHMGRRDIAEFLLEHNARLDVFAATMLGQLEIVKAAVGAFPGIINVPGPHKIPLLAHAEKGGTRAAAVLEFLRSLNRAA